MANVQLDVTNSTELSAVLSAPEGSHCAASSPARSCDQFHVIRFFDEPCSVSNAEMELTAELQCANGGEPSTCGYQSVKSTFGPLIGSSSRTMDSVSGNTASNVRDRFLVCTKMYLELLQYLRVLCKERRYLDDAQCCRR